MDVIFSALDPTKDEYADNEYIPAIKRASNYLARELNQPEIYQTIVNGLLTNINCATDTAKTNTRNLTNAWNTPTTAQDIRNFTAGQQKLELRSEF